jgi:cell division protein FtsB
VIVNSHGRLGTAPAASNPNGAASGENVTAQLKRQQAKNRLQTKEIATLKQQVAKLSRR